MKDNNTSLNPNSSVVYHQLKIATQTSATLWNNSIASSKPGQWKKAKLIIRLSTDPRETLKKRRFRRTEVIGY